MKAIKFLAVAFLTLLVAACSGSKNEDENSVTLSVEAELGTLANYMSVSDTEVTVTLSEETKKDETKKVIAASLAFDVKKSVASDHSFEFDVEVLDKNHIKIAKLPDFSLESNYDYDNGDLSKTLSAGNVRAQMRRARDVSDWNKEKQEEWDKIRTEGVYIVIKPSYSNAEYAEYKGGSTVDSDSDESSTDEADVDESESEDGTEDWDALLDSYEDFVDEYIALMKKAQQGDMSAVSEYGTYMEKAQELGDKMSKAQGQMSAAQWARYSKILQKMTKNMQ